VTPTSRRTVVAAEQPAEAFRLDDLPGGRVAARFGCDQLVPQSLVRPLTMKEAVDRLPPITRS
jgi:hypothetical protein